MEETEKTRFFISRAGEDIAWGAWIADILREGGYPFFLQEEDVQTGHSFVGKMVEGMEESDHVIAVISPDHLVKPHCQGELQSAYARDPTGEKRMLIMVRVRDCAIPKMYAHLVYLDLRKRDEQSKRMLLARIRGERASYKSTHRTFIAKLPVADPTLIGRDPQLAMLDAAWADAATNFIQIIAPGGTGKTALMTKWYKHHVGEATIFGWSFYSQGTGENRQTSSDPFFAEILPFFAIDVPPTASIYAKAEAIAQHMREEQVLLILDGIEPLQHPSGELKDPPLKALLHELSTHNKGLVLCTTRVRLTDIPDDAPHALSIHLDNLDPEHGAEYLCHLGVQGTEEELREASTKFGNHALALTLLGTYLVDFCDADVRRRIEIKQLIFDDTKPGSHARHVMEAYARMFEGQAEFAILRALGYFDRPAEPEALKLVLPEMDERKYRLALLRLRNARLILSADPNADLDCHPLVREHFAWVMRSIAPDAFGDGHSDLFEYYCKKAPELPNTLEEMTPLFYAVYHGCQAGRHQQALDDIYNSRVSRGSAHYLISKLGAFGTNLSLLANFFESPWTSPLPGLSPAAQSWVISGAAFSLRALGRLNDAVDPMNMGATAEVMREDWKNASISFNNLNELHLGLGGVNDALDAARKSVDFAERSDDLFQRLGRRATLADALHQSGHLGESAILFQESESLQSEFDPEIPILCSLFGYQYCDLLLTENKSAEVLRRAAEALAVAERNHRPLEIGLNHLSLGRAHPPNSPESVFHLNQAVNDLRRAGQLDYLPLALLARGTQQDLDEVYRIATRSGMRLHLTDYHLAMARRLASTDPDKAREHLNQAATLVERTGYHRRDPEVAQLRETLK